MEHSTAYEIRMLRAIRRIIRAVDMHSKKLQHAQDITAPQLVCLLTLLKEGELTMKRLSQLVDLSPSTTVGVVDRLEVKALVQRTRSTHDRRQVFIGITEEGKKLAQDAPSPLQTRLIEGFKQMPESEQVAMTQAVEKLVQLMGAGDIDASAMLAIAPISENNLTVKEEHHP